MVPVELDRTRNLRYGLLSVRDLERGLNGKPLAQIINDLSLMSIDVLVLALLHGLRHEDAALNANLILKMLQQRLDEGESLQPIFHAVSKALDETGVFRTNEDVSEGKTKAPAPA